jgi:hypothetical protein
VPSVWRHLTSVAEPGTELAEKPQPAGHAENELGTPVPTSLPAKDSQASIRKPPAQSDGRLRRTFRHLGQTTAGGARPSTHG